MSSKKQDDVVDQYGIPLKSDYDQMGTSLPVTVIYVIFSSVFLTIGMVVAWVVYSSNSAKYDAKISLLAANDLGWVYIGLVIIGKMMIGINGNLGQALKAAKVNVPDQQVYKVYTKPTEPKLGYVLMEQDGDLGRFNRAQRALQNYLEVAPFFLVNFLAAGFVFPFPAFCLGILYSIARIVYAVGYTHSPGGRMAGNFLGMFLLTTQEALVLLAGLKAVL